MKKYILLSLVLILFFFSIQIFADNTGIIKGRIVDEDTQKPLVNAKIIIVELGMVTKSQEDGSFILNCIPLRVYSVEISYVGYHDHLQTGIAVGRNSAYQLGTIKMKKRTDTGVIPCVFAKKKLIKRVVGIIKAEISDSEIKDGPLLINRIATTVPGVQRINKNTGIIKGKVVDKNTGKPLINARVVVVELALVAQTDENGDFVFSGIPVNVYSVEIFYVSHQTYLQPGIIVDRNSTYQMGTIKMKKYPKFVDHISTSKMLPVSN